MPQEIWDKAGKADAETGQNTQGPLFQSVAFDPLRNTRSCRPREGTCSYACSTCAAVCYRAAVLRRPTPSATYYIEGEGHPVGFIGRPLSQR